MDSVELVQKDFANFDISDKVMAVPSDEELF